MQDLEECEEFHLPAIQRVNANQLIGQTSMPHSTFAKKKPVRLVGQVEQPRPHRQLTRNYTDKLESKSIANTLRKA